MIAMLRGTVASLTAGQVVLDVNGVGYLVRVPVGARIGATGSEVTFHTHLAVREDAMDLYGFTSTADRDLFQLLLSVSGVGPKLALSAVDTLGADGIRAAVIAEDIAGLTAIPGVGKKGAQRLVLELRNKIGAMPTSGSDALPGSRVTADSPRGEARQALSALGYAAAEVEHALRDLSADAPAEEQIRLALRGLA